MIKLSDKVKQNQTEASFEDFISPTEITIMKLASVGELSSIKKSHGKQALSIEEKNKLSGGLHRKRKDAIGKDYITSYDKLSDVEKAKKNRSTTSKTKKKEIEPVAPIKKKKK